MMPFTLTLFASSLPWSLEDEMICYFNSPYMWVSGFNNVEGVKGLIEERGLVEKNELFVKELSHLYNCDRQLIEDFFSSKIIIIFNEDSKMTDIDNWKLLFEIETFYEILLEGLKNGIVIVRDFSGAQIFLEIVSSFDAEFIHSGDFIVSSTDLQFINSYKQRAVNRNEFSEDILYYCETKTNNITLTNAYTFLNVENKTLIKTRDQSQFFLNLVELPFFVDKPDVLKLFSVTRTKEFFYENFEVVSSDQEWQELYKWIEKVCVYSIYFEKNNKWFMAFKAYDDYESYPVFQNYFESWGLNDQNTIKPYKNDYYINIHEDYFIISNFSLEDYQKNFIPENDRYDALEKLKEKVGKREVFESAYVNHEELGLNIYYFFSFDDKIKKEVYRIF